MMHSMGISNNSNGFDITRTYDNANEYAIGSDQGIFFCKIIINKYTNSFHANFHENLSLKRTISKVLSIKKNLYLGCEQ